ncbi:hypothetical protein RIF25_07260 [Thermosynechococcaceae cyanobacterium BACA0444]|uniref:Uncharacterized protein n=1 Tax=Pseudocalidococcus azoricus BACA0444 TaxID=2918990 RepID=A0AAE4JZA5_9CYAN|nr:hypothetical protein [Pseudocalidococcus azoricus BACA0444]
MLKLCLQGPTHSLRLGLSFALGLSNLSVSAQARIDFGHFTYPNQGTECELAKCEGARGEFRGF